MGFFSHFDDNVTKDLSRAFGGRVSTLSSTTIQHTQQTDLNLPLYGVAVDHGVPADRMSLMIFTSLWSPQLRQGYEDNTFGAVFTLLRTYMDDTLTLLKDGVVLVPVLNASEKEYKMGQNFIP